jgi:hypothetical protein
MMTRATSSQSGGAQNLLSAVSYYPILLLALLRIALLRRWRLRPPEKLVAVRRHDTGIDQPGLVYHATCPLLVVPSTITN